MKCKIMIAALTACLFLSTTGPVFGQSFNRPRDLQSRLTIYYLKSMARALELTPEQARSITIELKEIQKTMPPRNQELIKQVAAMRMELRSEEPDTNEVSRLLAQIRTERKYMSDREEAIEKAVNKYLNVGQQARFILFQIRFKKELQALLDRVRRNAD